MANETKCQTPGAIFHTEITLDSVACKVDLPFQLELDEEQAKMLEANIHNAFELVLARYFNSGLRPEPNADIVG